MEQNTDYDSPWKEMLECYFAEFMAFFFPQIYTEIDWSRGYKFLDKELRQVVRDAELGLRLVDKLVEVCHNNGEEKWVLVHVEIQSQREPDFAKRMYVYNYRIFDRYDRTVVSLAVLGDAHQDWRPDTFGYKLWGCKIDFEYPVAKLLDYSEKGEMLDESHNPFATVIMAHLKVQEEHGNPENLRLWKIRLTKRLYGFGYQKEDIIKLFQFIDWLIRLPDRLEDEFWKEVQQYEEEKRMRYVTSVERIGIKKGMEQGMKIGMEQGIKLGIEQGIEQGIERGLIQGMREGILSGIEFGLELKFGNDGLGILPEICKIDDIDVLRAIQAGIKVADNLDELIRIYK